MTIEVDLTEVADLADVLAKAPDQAFKVSKKAIQAGGRQIKSRARAAAPRDSGVLAESIYTRSWSFKGDSHTDVFTVPDERGFNVGFYVEFGTSKMAPRPFLGPQLEPVAAVVRAAIEAGLNPLKPGVVDGPA